MSSTSIFRRLDSLESVRFWISNCNQNLLITAPALAGKTEFAKQLSSASDCCAIHYCSSSVSDSTESATFFRSIGNQLVARFPNLILPCLSTVTLLSDCASSLLQYFSFPLAVLPKPNKPFYVVIDGITEHQLHLVEQLISCVPPWLRIVLLTRPIPSSEMFRFKDFHQIVLNENVEKFCRFIESRLPQCNSQMVLECSQDSWFYIDLLSRSISVDLFSADCIPLTPESLINEVIKTFPQRFPVYLYLLKCCRRPPSFRAFLSVCYVAINDIPSNIEKELEAICIIFTSKDPVSVCSAWSLDADLSPFHSFWSQFYKTKTRKTVEDIVELAYHLAHSTISPLDAIETLHSLGCSDLILRCSVIDVPTTILPLKAGATVLDQTVELISCLPPWLRIVLLTRPIPSSEMFRFKDFHQIVLNENVGEFCRFIESRLPQCNSQMVLECSQDSWFYIDLLSRSIASDLFSADCIPLTSESLTNEIIQTFPHRFPVYLYLLKCCRRPPSFRAFLSVCYVAINDIPSNIEKELETISIIFTSKDPVSICSAWSLYADLAPFHSFWSQFYKTKTKKTPEDIVELAYHLAHSTISPLDAIETLHSLGCSDLILRCSVIDVPTTILLLKAGATVLDQTVEDDFDYLCSTGDGKRVAEDIEKKNEILLCQGLLAACSRGHLVICKQILAVKPQAHFYVSPSKWNALRTAATNNHLEIMEMLIKAGANVADSGLGGRTALRAAAWAGHSSIVSHLLSLGSFVDTKDEQNRTSLMAAAFMDNRKVVEVLLEYGANCKETDFAGATALHLTLANGACSEEHDETVRILIENGSDVTQCDSHGRNCVHIAAFHGDKNLQKIIEKTNNLDAQDSFGRTSLMLASSQGRVEAVQVLLEKGSDIDFIDEYGRTSLQLAAIGGHLGVVDLLLTMGADEAHKVVRELLSLGADPLISSLDGQTALRAAVLNGNTRSVHALSDYIADWNQKDIDGTPLLHSLFISKQLSMAELLLSYGASTSATDSHERTCAHIVCSMNDLVAVRLLHRLGTSFETKDEGGRTPLMTAVWSNHIKVAVYLLDTVAVDPNATDNQGASALSVAAQLGFRDLLVQLLRFGADASLHDKMGRTALEVATISGHLNLVGILQTASGSADSSGFGSMPNSPSETKSMGRKSINPFKSPLNGRKII